MSQTPLSVSSITAEIKTILEEEFSQISVIGEVSGLKKHGSGHWYFNLKDSESSISCSMWRSFNALVSFPVNDGDKIIVSGKISVYPPRGTYQIDVRSMKPVGIGDLQALFEDLKRKLHEEGLFSAEYKKSLPELPLCIGIVTSADGAALQDMLKVARRRFPLLSIVIAPAKVQGAGAAEEIAKAINELDKFGKTDVIIIGRGGGSLEDLWAFNEETVARAIFTCKTPVVSAVGHEIDFTISDFVADIRAATPTEAMELVTPLEHEALVRYTQEWSSSFSLLLGNQISDISEKMRLLFGAGISGRLLDSIRKNQQRTDFAFYKIQNNVQHSIKMVANKLEMAELKIQQGNIERTLKKGFVLVKQKDKFVLDGKNLSSTDPVELRFRDQTVKLPS